MWRPPTAAARTPMSTSLLEVMRSRLGVNVSTGAGTVVPPTATNAGFIKLYVGTTPIWVPYWTTITGWGQASVDLEL
jgi:hypothetical protein